MMVGGEAPKGELDPTHACGTSWSLECLWPGVLFSTTMAPPNDGEGE